MKVWDQDGSPVAPSERLFHLLTLGLQHEHGWWSSYAEAIVQALN